MTKKIVMMLILIPSWGMRMCSDLLPWFATKLLWKELKNIYRPLNIRIIWKISPLSVEKGVISSQYARFLFRYSFKMYKMSRQVWLHKRLTPKSPSPALSDVFQAVLKKGCECWTWWPCREGGVCYDAVRRPRRPLGLWSDGADAATAQISSSDSFGPSFPTPNTRGLP